MKKKFLRKGVGVGGGRGWGWGGREGERGGGRGGEGKMNHVVNLVLGLLEFLLK